MSLVENQKVLLKKDNCYRIVTISEKNVDLERLKFSLKGLIGHSFGSSFSVENGQLVKITDKSKFQDYERLKVENLTSEERSDNVDINVNRDNRNMNLNTKNQMLSASDIGDMKKSGESGDMIVDKLIENSTSFAQKTTFAQEKYLSKKKKRYMPIVTVHRLTTRMLCELFSSKNKLKIMNLRIDSVSQIIAYSNAHSGSRVLLSENCAGLLLGSLIERGANIINFFSGSAPILPDCYSDWSELNNRVYNLPLGQLVPLATNGLFVDHFVTKNDVEKVETTIENDNDNDNSFISDKTNGNKRQIRHDNGMNKRIKLAPETIEVKRNERDRRREEAREFLIAGPVDCIVVAIKLCANELVLRMMTFLAPGKPFVVYSQFLQPLVDLYDVLRKNSNVHPCCSLKITESWMRNYQVLPERTHPEMSMSGTGGYLLTGIKLEKM